MLNPFSLVAIIIGLGVVLTYAILFLGQQRKLSEKKAILLMHRKDLEQLNNRNEYVINELLRIKPEYKKKHWDLKLMRLELNDIREDIRTVIHNIRHDSDGNPDGASAGLGRVVARRKEMLKAKLEEYKNRKAICLGRQQVVEAAGNAVNTLISEQDDNISRLETLTKKIKNAEIEFEALSNAAIIKMPKLFKKEK